MKLIHLPNKSLPEGAGNWVRGQAAEKAGDTAGAIQFYEAALKEKKGDLNLLQRLMILYRKMKNYKKELRIVDAAITAYAKHFKPSSSKNKKVAELSKLISLSTGLTDKKGTLLHDPEPIATWKKRREGILKKMPLPKSKRL